MPGLLKIFLNIGTVISLFKNLKLLVEEVIKNKKPSVENIDKVLESVEDIFTKKLIDIPNVEEEDIAIAIQNIRNQISGVKP